jgi:hypothetical protein
VAERVNYAGDVVRPLDEGSVRDAARNGTATGGDGNAILCYACYLHEMAYRKDLVKGQMPPDLPAWKSLKVYEGTR